MPTTRSRNGSRDHECRGGREPANEHRLTRTAERRGAGKASFDITKNSQRDERHDHRYGQRRARLREKKVRPERDEAAGDVSSGNRSGTDDCALGIGLLKTEL